MDSPDPQFTYSTETAVLEQLNEGEDVGEALAVADADTDAVDEADVVIVGVGQ
jgi:hypothetical protein